MTIDGKPVSGPGTFEVLDPATEQVVGLAPRCSEDQLGEALRSAQNALPGWAADSGARRAALRETAKVVRASAAELGPLFTREQGRPVGEIALSADWLDYYAGLELPVVVVHDDARRRVEVTRRPVGPVAAITPWNAPVLLAMWKVAAALSAGTTMVLKPSPFTPLTTLALASRMANALPAGVLNVISGEEPLGHWMVTHPVPRKVSFTGSVGVGTAVAVAAAGDLKRVTLELGGNDAALVLDDADPDSVAAQIWSSAFANSGQICEATKRVFVPRRLQSALVDALADRARSAKLGHGLEEGVELGPLTTEAQRDRIVALVEDAVTHGARVVTGGRCRPGPGYFYEPTIVTQAAPGQRLVDEEQFGPALPVIGYDDLEEAVHAVNATPYGLGSSVWGTDTSRARAVADRLQVGMVKINGFGGVPGPDAPFAGIKHSGVGVENGPWGLLEYTDVHVTQTWHSEGEL